MSNQRAYEAVYAYIDSIGIALPTDAARRNAMIWTAVQAALEADEQTEAVNTVARIRQIHQPDPNPRSGWNADDSAPSEYGTIERACRECGATDMAVPWPCPTLRALGGDDA